MLIRHVEKYKTSGNQKFKVWKKYKKRYFVEICVINKALNFEKK